MFAFNTSRISYSIIINEITGMGKEYLAQVDKISHFRDLSADKNQFMWHTLKPFNP